MTDHASMIRDLTFRSERAHLFYCYNLLLQLASASKPATAWLPTENTEDEQDDISQFAYFSSKELATSCLQVLGEEMGFPA
jgi:hypothetical protein